MRPAVPLYWRATPADFVPSFRKPVSSTISTASRSARDSTTYARHRSRAAASSHCTCESSRCVRHGRASPRCSANCQPFLRSTALRRPWRYSPPCRRGSDRPNSSPKRACKSLSSHRHSKILATLKRRPAAIHHRSQRYSPYACKLNCSTSKATAAAAQCGVVRDTQLLPEQPKDARGEAFGLAQGKVEDKPEHQHQLDRGVRIPGLTARRGPPRRLPTGDGGLVQPECQVAAPLQTSLVSRPVLDPIAGLRDAVTARGIVLERQARDRNGSAAAGPPAPAPDGSMHQRHVPSHVGRPG